MKKLEMTIIQNAIAGRTTTDLFTDRQAATARELAEAGLIRIERDERLKPNLVIVEYKGGTAATVRAAEDAQESEESEQEGNTDGA